MPGQPPAPPESGVRVDDGHGRPCGPAKAFRTRSAGSTGRCGVASSRRGGRAALGAFAAFALFVVAPSASAQDPRAVAAQEAARQWLAYADRLDADTTHRLAGGKFRETLTLGQWRAKLKSARGPLGEAEQRAVMSTQLTRSEAGLPEATFARVEFRTSWPTKWDGREFVSLERDNGHWRVVGYVIQ